MVHVHMDLVLHSVAIDPFVGVSVQADDRRHHVELHFGREGVDDGFRIPFPDLHDRLLALSDQGVGLDCVDAVVVSGNKQFACVCGVGEPKLVLGQKPVWVMLLEQLFPCHVLGLGHYLAWNFLLYKGLP